MFIRLFESNPRYALMQLFVVIVSVCTHEYAHARVALWQGDDTAAEEGHLTLNPFVQMGPYSLVLLVFLGIAWGQVPVNPDKFKHHYSDFLVSLAGPLTNFMFYIVGAILHILCILFFKNDSASLLTGILVRINFLLFVINILPIPAFGGGLDGWHVFKYIFPKMEEPSSEMGKGTLLIIILVLFFSAGKVADFGVEIVYYLFAWSLHLINYFS